MLRSLLALACTALPFGSAAAQDEPAPLPFTSAFGLIFVELHARDGAPLLALLDTGASASAIDPRRSAELPALAKEAVVGTTGSIEVEMVEVAGLRLGATELPKLRATRRDLSGLLAPEGERVEAILGSDALAGVALTIDFEKRTLTLGPSSPKKEGVPMRLDNRIPTLPARIAGRELELRIDTGSSMFASDDVYVNVPARVWSALREQLPDLAPSAQLEGSGLDGKPVPLPVYRVPDATIAGRELPAAFVIVQPEVGYFASKDAKGFLGNNFLEKLGRVELDYGAQKFRCAAK